MKRRILFICFVLLALVMAACTQPPPPSVTIQSPADNSTVETETVTVEGTVEGTVDSVSYAVDTGDSGEVTVTDGEFSFEATLVEGKNEISVTAEGAGTEASDSVTVTYAPPVTVTITSPEDDAVVNTETISVEGTVSGPYDTLTYSVNGGEATELTVTDSSFSFQVTLVPGSNTITVTATHGDETVTAEVTVTYALDSDFEYTGTLSDDDPTFVRPESSSDKITGGLSVEARTVHYDAFSFAVAEQDYYAISSEQNFDGYLVLYEGSFDPENPAENVVAFNDDFGTSFDPDNIPPGISGLILELMPDTTYVLVTTAYAGQTAEDFALGNYANSIVGGQPEPEPDFELPEPNNDIYNITVRFVGGLTEDQQATFTGAAERWSQIITGDVENVENFYLPPSFFFEGTGAITGTLDDLIIDVAGVELDGPGGTLAAAGSLLIRSDATSDPVLPAYGIMFVDVGEFGEGGIFEDPQVYEDTIVHEMAHVVGFQASRFDAKGLVEGVLNNPPTVPPGLPNPDYDPRFIGDTATAEYQELLNAAGRDSEDSVPLANDGGPGNYNSHWREITFDNELMTPYLGGTEKLTSVTAAAFGDFGYTVDLDSAALDTDYVLPPPYVPGEFRQTAPDAVEYVEGQDFVVASDSPLPSNVAGEVVNVDLNLDDLATSTSACEASDFDGLDATGKIALVRRGSCAFETKVLNAIDAGATGVIIMNQGVEGATGLLDPVLGTAADTVPVVFITSELGIDLANTSGLEVEIQKDAPADAPTVRVRIDEILLDPVGTVDASGDISFFEGAELDILAAIQERLEHRLPERDVLDR